MRQRLDQMDVLERNDKWSATRNQKIKKAKKIKRNKELMECTFEPQITEYKPVTQFDHS